MIPVVTTVSDAEKYFLLHSPPRMKGNYDLQRMNALMHFLGDPQETLKIIHIAGTSGKTSTAYFLRGMLEAAGMKTGLTVSPHIVSIKERTQVHGLVLPDEIYVRYVNEFQRTIAGYKETGLTYFELLIAFSYWVFWKEKVDYAIIETGLGGRLDATNVVSRVDKVCVITPIGYDHTEILGETLPQIAREKAGIIGQQNLVVMSAGNSEVADVFAEVVTQNNAVMQLQSESFLPEKLVAYQHENWQLAHSVYTALQQRNRALPVLSDATLDAIALQTPPGRYEQYRIGETLLILDGAHNPQKLQAFFASLDHTMLKDSVVLFGLKDAPEAKIAACIECIAHHATRGICTEFQVGQDIKQLHSSSAQQLSAMCMAAGLATETIADYRHAFEALLEAPGRVKIVTGSLYLVAHVRALLLEDSSNNYIVQR